MSETVTQSALDANLAAIACANADVATLLQQATPATDVTFSETQQDLPAGAVGKRSLCSRHRPRDEAQRMVESVDLINNGVIAVLGFGMGYHVQAIAERMGKAGLIIVYEPDLSLIRAVLERVDHSRWMRDTNLVWVCSAGDQGAMGRKLAGTERIFGHGVAFFEHAPSRDRLGSRAREFSHMLNDFMQAAKTSLLTRMVRASDTIRNLVFNLDHYVAGDGVADLKDAASGYPAVVVSAGPSLQRNIHLLSQPGVRDRVVIIAVQTVLKPLLAAGIRPHFVTSLDFHEISRRFFEGIDAESVKDVTLVAEPKVHPVVLDSFPGRVRCCSSRLLDELLGELRRDMGQLPAGSTVAHLAVYLARHLGCDPIAMIGQDLGFTDGLYYGSGTAIDDVWSPELNPFNTIEMMQWQRIVRHRQHLHKATDVHGRSIYSDAQMMTYLRQFERDFGAYRAEGVNIIDASEGGMAKAHVQTSSLQSVLETWATRQLPDLQRAAAATNSDAVEQRLAKTIQRVQALRTGIGELRELSRRTHRLIDRMMDDQADESKMTRHFRKLKQFQDRVAARKEAFNLLEYLNQLGSFNRSKADRQLMMRSDLAPMQRQRLELQRDRDNVVWIQDAAQVMSGHLDGAMQVLRGNDTPATQPTHRPANADSKPASKSKGKVAALVPVDLHRNGLGIPRSLSDRLGDGTILQATLERLAQVTTVQRIILITPRDADIEQLMNRRRIAIPIDIEYCEGDSPFGPAHRAVAAARLFSPASWRGGIAGMSVYDEVLCPGVMNEIMQRRELDAALIVGPDWPLLNPGADGGCDALVQRFLAQPDSHNLVFTQSPPGLCGCVVSAKMMKRLAQGDRLSTIGAQLVYQPRTPRADPVGLDANVQIDHRVRHAMLRATCDASRHRDAVAAVNEQFGESNVVAALEAHQRDHRSPLPQHLLLELTTQRTSCGQFANRLAVATGSRNEEGELDIALAQRLIAQVAEVDDAVLTLAGRGDPLLHSACCEIIKMAKDAGVRAVHVRTELLVEHATLDQLLECGVDVISVDLHADCPATYQAMMGLDRFQDVIKNIEHLVNRRTRFGVDADGSVGPDAASALALPWIVPRLQRCERTYDDLESFFDRWQHLLGTAVVEGGPGGKVAGDSLTAAVMPPKVVRRELAQRMLVLCDGNVPVCEVDVAGETVGNIARASLNDLWSQLQVKRSSAKPAARICFP